ncbi:MAG: T9SS type A sorting domain-containing protein [Bacteroidota bacterium]
MNNDGYEDVLGTWNNTIWYYENNNDQLSGDWIQNTINTNVLDVVSLHAADIDNDGDLDVLSASMGDDRIAWYENLINPTTNVENLTSLEMKVYPNPTSSELFIELPVGEPAKASLYSMDGVLIMEQELREINILDLSDSILSGIYLLTVVSGQGRWIRRIVKH